MCSAYAFGFLPHAVYILCVDYQDYSVTDIVLTETSGMLYYFSAIVNPLTTITAKEDYRKTMLALLRLLFKGDDGKERKKSSEDCPLRVTKVS